MQPIAIGSRAVLLARPIQQAEFLPELKNRPLWKTCASRYLPGETYGRMEVYP